MTRNVIRHDQAVVDLGQSGSTPLTRTLSSRLIQGRRSVHIDAENSADLNKMIASFHRPRYEVIPMGAVFEGEQPVRDLVADLMGGAPDFCFAPVKFHHADDAVIVEARMTATHRVAWAGLAPKGNKLDLPLVCIFDFEGGHLVNEKVFSTSPRRGDNSLRERLGPIEANPGTTKP